MSLGRIVFSYYGTEGSICVQKFKLVHCAFKITDNLTSFFFSFFFLSAWHLSLREVDWDNPPWWWLCTCLLCVCFGILHVEIVLLHMFKLRITRSSWLIKSFIHFVYGHNIHMQKAPKGLLFLLFCLKVYFFCYSYPTFFFGAYLFMYLLYKLLFLIHPYHYALGMPATARFLILFSNQIISDYLNLFTYFGLKFRPLAWTTVVPLGIAQHCNFVITVIHILDFYFLKYCLYTFFLLSSFTEIKAFFISFPLPLFEIYFCSFSDYLCNFNMHCYQQSEFCI